MRSVITGDKENATGYAYYMDGYDLIGKTGTAQIYDYTKGRYIQSESDYIYSFSGMFPGENPEIIVYAALKSPKDATNYIAPMIKDVEINITKYLNIVDKVRDKEKVTVESYYNKNVSSIRQELEGKNIKVLVLGDGDRIIDQYPSTNSIIYEDDLVILKTNHLNNIMPNLINYSYKEAVNILKLMNVNYNIEGSGYVYEQSIPEGVLIEDTVYLRLKEKYT